MKITLHKLLRKAGIIIYPSVSRDLIYQEINNINWKDFPNEEGELLLIELFLNKDSVFFDVGANNGDYIYTANKIVPEQNIFAFEPIPKSYNQISRTFKNACIQNIALSDMASKNARLKIPVIDSKKFYTRSTLQTQFKEKGEEQSIIINVKVSTIDEFVKEKKLQQIDMIKVDVEGAEFKVVKGAVESIRKFRPVLQIEIEQRHHDYPITEIIDFIRGLGYECYYLNPDMLKICLLNRNPVDMQNIENIKTKHYINNFYFLPLEKYNTEKLEHLNDLIEEKKSQF